MILKWSVLALGDRNAIFDSIEAESPRAATDIDDRIREAVERLAEFPRSGRPGRMDGTRELVISRSPATNSSSVRDAAATFPARNSASYKTNSRPKDWPAAVAECLNSPQPASTPPAGAAP